MKPIIIANWKCNPTTLAEAKKLFASVKKGISKKAEIIVCPPFVYLPVLKRLKVGGQDCFWEEKGAFTGEVSAKMLKNLGCQYVIIGHSERRRYFGETDETVNKKLKAAIEAKLIPIFCVGETKEEREQEKTEAVLRKQITAGLEGISSGKFSNGIIAYEPVWAIGTGNACDTNEAQTMSLVIRKILAGIFNSSFSKKIPILYGGSVNSKNAEGYIKEAGFQGLLVGGASLEGKEFVKITWAVV